MRSILATLVLSAGLMGMVTGCDNSKATERAEAAATKADDAARRAEAAAKRVEDAAARATAAADRLGGRSLNK
jgi:hypothetical protein